MRIHVQTRGQNKDYAFLGGPPEKGWWRDVAGLTSFERPTLLVHADDTGWRLYAGGIASARRDRTGSTIRFTVVLSGTFDAPDTPDTPDVHDAPDTVSQVFGLVRSWFATGGSQPGEPLSDAFDEVLDEITVEEALAGLGADREERIERLAGQALRAVAATPPPDLRDEQTPWWLAGSATDDQAVRAFLARANRLVAGEEQGWAVRLNLAGAADVEEFIGRSHPASLAALIDDDEVPNRPKALPAAPEPPRPPALPAPPPAVWLTPARRRLAAGAVGLLVLVGVLLVLLGCGRKEEPSRSGLWSPLLRSDSTPGR